MKPSNYTAIRVDIAALIVSSCVKQPTDSSVLARTAIGILFRPPTLIPRNRAIQVCISCKREKISSTFMRNTTFFLEKELGWFERQKVPDILVLIASKQCLDREL